MNSSKNDSKIVIPTPKDVFVAHSMTYKTIENTRTFYVSTEMPNPIIALSIGTELPTSINHINSQNEHLVLTNSVKDGVEESFIENTIQDMNKEFSHYHSDDHNKSIITYNDKTLEYSENYSHEDLKDNEVEELYNEYVEMMLPTIKNYI